MSKRHCPGCGGIVEDDDTVCVDINGKAWHVSCLDHYRRFYGPAPVDQIRILPPTIEYQITPRRFILDIPVEALANLNADAHTRLLAMLNAWITEHKPKPIMVPQQDKKP